MREGPLHWQTTNDGGVSRKFQYESGNRSDRQLVGDRVDASTQPDTRNHANTPLPRRHRFCGSDGGIRARSVRTLEQRCNWTTGNPECRH